MNSFCNFLVKNTANFWVQSRCSINRGGPVLLAVWKAEAEAEFEANSGNLARSSLSKQLSIPWAHSSAVGEETGK